MKSMHYIGTVLVDATSALQYYEETVMFLSNLLETLIRNCVSGYAGVINYVCAPWLSQPIFRALYILTSSKI